MKQGGEAGMFKRKFGSDLTYRFDGKTDKGPGRRVKRKKQPNRLMNGSIDWFDLS